MSLRRRLDRVEQALAGRQQSGQPPGGRPGVEEAGEQIAAAYFDGAPPPAWMTADEWSRVADGLRRAESIYDDLTAAATSVPSPRTFGTNDEPYPPLSGDQREEFFCDDEDHE
jgi:hypothetical protein